MPLDDELNITERRNLEMEMSETIFKLFNALGKQNAISQDNAFISEALENVHSLINKLRIIFEDSQKVKMLNGEFNKDIMYKGGDIKKNVSSIPLYFDLDIMISILANNYSDKVSDKVSLNQLIQNLKILRSKAAGLEFAKGFQPNEEINLETMNEIIRAGITGGHFEVTSKDGVCQITPVISHTGISGNPEFVRGNALPLYKKDALAIEEEKHRAAEKFSNILGPYFLNSNWDMILGTSKFEEILKIIKPGTNDEIVNCIMTIWAKFKSIGSIPDLATLPEVAETLDKIIEIENQNKNITVGKEVYEDTPKEKYKKQNKFQRVLNRVIDLMKRNKKEQINKEELEQFEENLKGMNR